MSWRIAIRHVTGYRYESEVESSYNEARITPLTTLGQLTLDATVEVSPAATVLRYWDYWGTLVHAFDVHVPHTELVVTANSVVETSDPPPPDPAVGWGALRAKLVADRFGEFLATTSFTPRWDGIHEVAHELIAAGDPREACDAAVGWVHDHLRYEAGATDVASSATDALANGAGVCQDFSHVALSLLRAMGIPSRYVSGYLHPFDDAEIGDNIRGESHAWVEAWVGDWIPLEPTSGASVGNRHVIVGRGRDYSDVAPLKGIFHGGPSKGLGVVVELTRLA